MPQEGAHPPPEALPRDLPPPDAERRQLTVLFCDLVDSTVLARQLDPEDLREVVRAYQEACAKVIARFEGHIAQYLGDGLLVYFGYPLAHEDDAQQAVRAGLGMIDAVGQLNTPLEQERGVRLTVHEHPYRARCGWGGGGRPRQEQLALGETPNLAARLQGIAAPDTLVISAVTFQLLGGFLRASRWVPPSQGFLAAGRLSGALREHGAQSPGSRWQHRVAPTGGPGAGSDFAAGPLGAGQRWPRTGAAAQWEAGIGKSRLVRVLTEQVASEPQALADAVPVFTLSPAYRPLSHS